MRDVWATPRPVPSRLVPVAGGAAVVALALPVFVAAGWPLRGWALGAILWLCAQALGVLLSRLQLGADLLIAHALTNQGQNFAFSFGEHREPFVGCLADCSLSGEL